MQRPPAALAEGQKQFEGKGMDIYRFWRDVLEQNADAIREYFDENAYINWHCTNEHFTVEEYLTANCEYPGSWDGEVERVERINDLFITVTHVHSRERNCRSM